MDKGKRGGKHANDIVTSQNQEQRRKRANNVESDGWTYDFYNPKLGPYTVQNAANREDAIKKAEARGYSEQDLRRRKRR